MTSPLADLYQEVILDHNRRPRNFRVIAGARCQEGYNPLCGDRVKVYVTVADGVLTDVAFEGNGCAISKASASLMTEALRGKPLDEALRVCEGFKDMVTGPHDEPAADLGKLTVLAGVREYPSRVKCASLAWHALKAALGAEAEAVVTTE